MYHNGETHIESEIFLLAEQTSRKRQALDLMKQFFITEIDCGDIKLIIPLLWPGLIVLLAFMGYTTLNYLFYVD